MKIIKKNKGFSLLEILITTFIFSFAMLSLALMQMNGMKHGHSANLQSVANMQALNIMEKMRANRVDVIAENYDLSKSASPSGGGVVFEELTQWRDDLKKLLPEGTGSIDCDTPPLNPAGLCRVTIFWSSIHPNPDSPLIPEELSFMLVSRL